MEDTVRPPSHLWRTCFVLSAFFIFCRVKFILDNFKWSYRGSFETFDVFSDLFIPLALCVACYRIAVKSLAPINHIDVNTNVHLQKRKQIYDLDTTVEQSSAGLCLSGLYFTVLVVFNWSDLNMSSLPVQRKGNGRTGRWAWVCGYIGGEEVQHWSWLRSQDLQPPAIQGRLILLPFWPQKSGDGVPVPALRG